MDQKKEGRRKSVGTKGTGEKENRQRVALTKCRPGRSFRAYASFSGVENYAGAGSDDTNGLGNHGRRNTERGEGKNEKRDDGSTLERKIKKRKRERERKRDEGRGNGRS